MDTGAMKDSLIFPLMGATVLTAMLINPAAAVPTAMIFDNYIGSDSHGYGDVIGSTSNFQIYSMDVSLSGNMLSVSILTTFAGKGDNGLFDGVGDPNLTGGTGIGYADLFLSSAWNPNGSAPYTGDDNSNGTIWSYGFSLDDHWMNENSNGTGTLYSLNSGNNDADILLSDDFLTGGIYRNGQEVAVDTTNGDITAIAGNSSWNIDAANDRVNFMIDLTGTNLLMGNEIALHWGFTCANDVIEGAYSVPEPGILVLLATGLIGIAGITSVKRRHSQTP